MLNRTAVVFIGLSMLAAAVGLVMLYTPSGGRIGGDLLRWGLGVGQVTSLLLLLGNGRIIGTSYFKIILFCFGFTLIGFLFKLMHWAWADTLLIASLAGIMATYLVWFASKNPKKQLDVLKLAWVLLACVGVVGVPLHWLPRDFTYLPNCLLWLVVGEFIRTDFSAGSLEPVKSD